MYNLRGDGPSGGGACPKQPDYKAQLDLRKSEFEIIDEFRSSLVRFIKVVGIHTALGRDGRNPMAELLGTVEIDLIQRKSEMERISQKLHDA